MDSNYYYYYYYYYYKIIIIKLFMDPLIFPNTLLEKCQNFTEKFC